jgi:uncharacterized delta-60 repeat protein
MHNKIIGSMICILMISTIFVIEIPKDVSAQFTEKWVARYDAVNDGDYSNAITVDSFGNIYVTGYSYIGDFSDYATIAYDPSGNVLWTARYNGPADSSDYPYDIAVDSLGNIYVTGKSYTLGEIPTSPEFNDIATVAYNSFGHQLWVARYNGPGNGSDEASAISVGPQGNIYVTGKSHSSTMDLDYITIAYDPNGNQLWIARYNGPWNYDDYANALAVDLDGNVYVTGYSTGNGSVGDCVTVAYNSSGDQLWVVRYDGPTNLEDEGYALALDYSENIFITGRSHGGPYSGMDFITIAYDLLGNQKWLTRTNFTGYSRDLAFDITVDDFGRIYVTGGTTPGNPQEEDYLTVAYDSNGNQLWMARYDGPINNYDRAYAIAADSKGNVFVTGRSKSNPTTSDYATIAYDSDGNQLWVARYSGPGNGGDEARDMDIDSEGNVYVTGYSKGIGTGSDFATIKYSRPIIQSNIDIDPNTLNLKSKGKWITAYITVNSPYVVNDIDISTVILDDTILAEWGDVQGTTLMVKFDRSEVEDYIGVPKDAIELTVTGEFFDGTQFEGTDTIRVINPPK